MAPKLNTPDGFWCMTTLLGCGRWLLLTSGGPPLRVWRQTEWDDHGQHRCKLSKAPRPLQSFHDCDLVRPFPARQQMRNRPRNPNMNKLTQSWPSCQNAGGKRIAITLGPNSRNALAEEMNRSVSLVVLNCSKGSFRKLRTRSW